MEEEVKERILKCIDKGLDSIGENMRYVIYWHVQKNMNLHRDEIPEKPAEFVRALRSIFGAGADILERQIIREIIREFGVSSTLINLEEAIRAVGILRQKMSDS